MTNALRTAAAVLVISASFVTPGSVAGVSPGAQAPAAQAGKRAERTAWYFYKVKWGFQEEFVALFNKNHLPVLRDQIKSGRMVSVRTFVPSYHGDGRADWTFAVEITFRDTAAMTGPSGEADIVKRLYPDQATFNKEEGRRFELLDAHWDVPLNDVTPADGR